MKSLKHSFCPTLAFICSAFILTSCTPQKNVVAFEAMNTFMTIQTYGRNGAKTNEEINKKILNLENQLSTTLNQSYIYRININSGNFVEVDNETADLIGYAKKMAEITEGALNPALYPVIKAWGFTTGNYKVPADEEIKELLTHTDYSKIEIQDNRIKIAEKMMIDLGAIGKGYAGDCAIEIMKKNGISSALMDLGGNVQALGTKPDGTEWTIGIKDPSGKSAVAAIKIKDKAVITSGGYERYFTENGKNYIHIFDGKTGYPVENDLLSATIICDSGIYGDALSTSLFVMGSEKAQEFWKKHKDFDVILITKDNKIIYTNNIGNKITILGTFDQIEIWQ